MMAALAWGAAIGTLGGLIGLGARNSGCPSCSATSRCLRTRRYGLTY
jgi:hypothetical protein